jgi:hypothetical protein
MDSWLSRLFGASPAPVYSPPKDTSWPDSSKADMAMRSYGSPAAAFVAPAVRDPSYSREARAPQEPEYSGRVRSAANPDALAFAMRLNAVNPLDVMKPKPMDAKTQKDMADAYLASQKSALAALGFDPRKMIVGTDKAAQSQDWAINGMYKPDRDAMFTTGRHPNTIVHESMHRGVEQLIAAGMLQPVADEERLIRANMQNSLGMIEQGKSSDREVTRGKMFLESEKGRSEIDRIEALAAQLIAQRTPRGPR